MLSFMDYYEENFGTHKSIGCVLLYIRDRAIKTIDVIYDAVIV